MKLFWITTISCSIFLTLFLNASQAQSLPDNIDISNSPNGVVDLPSTVPAAYISDGFVKYTKIPCPNGEAIHFIAQNNISIAQIVRARTILEFYLKDVPGSQFGSNKEIVKNRMGTNDATLLLLNGSDNGMNDPSVNGQPLYEEEMAVEGSAWYQNNNFDHRDASFEEILHMMHDMGIGVDGPNSIPNPALPELQVEIRAAQQNACANNFAIWPLGAGGSNPQVQSWYNELSQENSLSQEYLASVIDSYYGFWNPWTEDPNTGMWGIYIAHNREQIQTEDPVGFVLLSMYFSPIINVDMIIDPQFSGTFDMNFTEPSSYTSKSRYLQHLYLTGDNNSSIFGNDLYNRLKGNSGDNSFKGGKGNDCLNGKQGGNTAIFNGNYDDYTVTNNFTYAIIDDNILDRDGVDTLWNIQFLQFLDQTVPINLTYTSIIQNSSAEKDFGKIYPNPSSDFINIPCKDCSDIYILSIEGKMVKSILGSSEKNVKVDVSSFLDGLYIVQTRSKGVVNCSKFLKI